MHMPFQKHIAIKLLKKLFQTFISYTILRANVMEFVNSYPSFYSIFDKGLMRLLSQA